MRNVTGQRLSLPHQLISEIPLFIFCLQPGVREAVAATHMLETIWKNLTDAYSYATWREVGTKEGVFRKLPGTRLPRGYDPTKRHW